LVQAFLKKKWVESDFKGPNLPLSLRFKGSGCQEWVSAAFVRWKYTTKKKAIILKKDKIKITFYGGEMGDPRNFVTKFQNLLHEEKTAIKNIENKHKRKFLPAPILAH
jgi:hypothetical protein